MSAIGVDMSGDGREGMMVSMNDDGTVTYTFSGVAVGTTLDVVADAYLPEGVDPLTSSYFDIWRLLHDRNEHDFGCTCGRTDQAARHLETCGVTPIYESMCRDYGTYDDLRKPIIDAWRDTAVTGGGGTRTLAVAHVGWGTIEIEVDDG